LTGSNSTGLPSQLTDSVGEPGRQPSKSATTLEVIMPTRHPEILARRAALKFMTFRHASSGVVSPAAMIEPGHGNSQADQQIASQGTRLYSPDLDSFWMLCLSLLDDFNGLP
jgi:hypothetical protein